MAIKGKKKTKSRPSSAKRRPAPATARAPVSAARPVPWHRSMGGQLTMILVALGIIAFVMWRVAETRSDNQAREARQTELRDLTTDVSDLVATVQEPVREMLGAAFNTSDPDAIEALTDSTDKWIEELEAAGARAQTLAPPEDLAPTGQILQQSFLLYGSAAKTYALVPGEDNNKRQNELIQRATDQRDQAGRLMVAALGILDEARDAAEMGPSGIQAPAAMAPILPSPAPSPSETAGQDGSGGAGGDGGGKKGDGSGGAGGDGGGKKAGKGSNDG